MSSQCVCLCTLVRTAVVAFRISELQSQLEEALSELEKLRESRHHQTQLVESIVRQRDMFRILLAQTTGAVIPLQGKPVVGGENELLKRAQDFLSNAVLV